MDRLGAGGLQLWESLGSAIWLMESRWILESCPHPAFNLAVRGRAVENAPGLQGPRCRAGPLPAEWSIAGSWASSFGGPVAFGAGVAWMKQLFLVSIFGLPARRLKPGAACGLWPLSAPGVDDDGQTLTLTACRHRSPGRLCIHSPPSSCLPVAILTPSRDMCARDGLSGTASAETSVRDVCCHPPSGPVRRPGFGMGCRRPFCRRHADDRCGSAGAHGDGDGERELNIVLISPVLGPVPADLPPAITHRPRPLVV